MPNIKKELFKNIRFTITHILLLLLFANLSFAQTKNVSTTKKSSNGEMIYQAEKLLSEKGYWITKVDKIKDSSTYHAVTAFQKVEGRKRTGVLNLSELEAIQNAKRPTPVYIGVKHIEVDIKRQVLFLVDSDDIVTHILPVSTGNGKAYYQDGKKQTANTPQGVFKITRQIKGIRKAPLGTLYHPNYFYQGFAIHGSNSIPFYPASHGCVRIPRFAAKGFSDLVDVGLTVVIHETSGQARLEFEQLNETEMSKRNETANIPCESKLIG